MITSYSPALDTRPWSQRSTMMTVNLALGILKSEWCITHHSLLLQMSPDHLNLQHSSHNKVKVHLTSMTLKAMQDLSGLVTMPQKIRQDFCTKRCLAGVVRQNYFSTQVKAFCTVSHPVLLHIVICYFSI